MASDMPLKTLRETVEVINMMIVRLQVLKESNLSLISQMEPLELTGVCPKPERLYLSPREISVLKLVGQGKSNQQIAQHFGLKSSYIKGVVSRLYDKLEVNDRGGMVLYAIKAGIVKVNEIEN